jgi:hypothetical protein
MTPAQAHQLKKAIRILVRAEIANSWIGSQSKEDHEIIKDELKSAKARISAIISRMTEKETP